MVTVEVKGIGGRKAKSRNRGFFYRTGRGWYVSTEGKGMIPLRDEDGRHIKDEQRDQRLLREAHARFLTAREEAIKVADKPVETTVIEAGQLYLEHCAANDSKNTYKLRAGFWFDFCNGLPYSMKAKLESQDRPSRSDIEAARIHLGFGNKKVDQLLPAHLDQWIAKHPTWVKSKRTALNAILRGLNYYAKSMNRTNPLKGYKRPKDNIRKTYITPEQEETLLKHANEALAWAIRICIRTGARYGKEFCKLEARHVTETIRGMEWRFAPEESKNKKLRIIRITDKAIIEYVREQIKKNGRHGPIFRSHRGKVWSVESLRTTFKQLIARLVKRGFKFDDGLVMYSCRHTFAKRTLNGYWTGKPTNIEILSKLMGNNMKTCWEHYADWCDTYTEPLWDAV